jgi:hypothetical protein
MNKWNGMHFDLSGSKAKITPAPKKKQKNPVTPSNNNDTNINQQGKREGNANNPETETR